MSFVNLIASIFVGTYRRVTMLRMKDDLLPKFNEVYIVNCLRDECKGQNDSERHQMVLAVSTKKKPAQSTPEGFEEPKFSQTNGSQPDGSQEDPLSFEGLS